MTTQEKLIRRKQSLLEPAEYLRTYLRPVKMNGFPPGILLDSWKVYEQGLEG